MTVAMLESFALALTLLIGFEMRRQQVPWQSVVVRSLIVFAVLTIMIVMWRGR
jgi:hypothetical protein